MIKYDGYREVINDPMTYEALAVELASDGSVILGWTDQCGTHLDILMSYNPEQFGHLQGGMHADTDLFVAISRYGMYGFELNGSWKAPGYIGEKLGLGGNNDTTTALADLINGVCKLLEEEWNK